MHYDRVLDLRLGDTLTKHLILAAVTLAALTTAAHAEWATTVEDDLFSDNKNAVMVGLISTSSSIYATCSGPDNVELSYIEASSDAADITDPMQIGDIVFKSDKGERFTSKTSVYRHNEKFVGFSFDDKSTVVDVIRDFAKAEAKIAVGLNLKFSESPFTATASARGSSKAVKDFIEACGLQESAN